MGILIAMILIEKDEVGSFTRITYPWSAQIEQSVVTDHGALGGLPDDDHPQYHNNARGDARYYTQAQVDGEIDGDISTHATETDAHHARYTDVEVQTAVNNDSDHGSTASHNYASTSSDVGLENVPNEDATDPANMDQAGATEGQALVWDGSQWGPEVVSLLSPTGPGSTDLDYDPVTDTGYYGLVTSAEICDGPTLAGDIGLSAGYNFNDDAGWLKYFVGKDANCNKDGVDKVVFLAKKTLRFDLDWDSIYLAGAVYGTGDNGVANSSGGVDALQDAEVAYGGYSFTVRLATGSATDPAAEGYDNQSCADDAGAGTEWNDLLYRVHTDVPDCGNPSEGMPGGYETEYHGGPQDGANWANFSNAELQVYGDVAGNGARTWCQEQGNDTSRRVVRGIYGLANFCADTASYTHVNCGWRPCLELIQP